jgi:acetolactate synthase-1/2/3 large subunit
VPVLNIVGDHATSHVPYDAQLQSDIETVARNVSPGFVRTSQSTAELCRDAVDALVAARGLPGQVATLILPADVSWGDGGQPAPPPPLPQPLPADDATVQRIAQALRSGEPSALLLGGRTARARPAGRGAVAAHCGVKLLAEVFPTRLERGAGLPTVERIAYLAELAGVQLSGLRHLVLVDAKSPVSFFAYPGKASDLVPAGLHRCTPCRPDQDATASLGHLVHALRAGPAQPCPAARRPPRPATRPAHRAQGLQGGGPPAAGGRHPDRRSHHLRPDAGRDDRRLPAPRPDHPHRRRHRPGPAQCGGRRHRLPGPPGDRADRRRHSMYTMQALWTMARERLNVTTVIFNNASYSVLNVELERVGASASAPRRAPSSTSTARVLNFAQLAQGMGVHAVLQHRRGLLKALEYALATPGPHLIEAMVPESLSGAKRRVLPWLLRSLPRLPQPGGPGAQAQDRALIDRAPTLRLVIAPAARSTRLRPPRVATRSRC